MSARCKSPAIIATPNVDIRGPGADKLTIDGGGHNTVFNASNATFEGLTITGGGGASERGGAVGGGINGQNITVRESRITGNTSIGNGGGIYSSGNLHIIDSEISGNAAVNGGGVWLRTTTGPYEIAIVNSTISGNQASNNGGGIFNYEVQYGEGLTFNITHSTITDNTAANGGGVYNFFDSSYEGPFSAPPKINNTIIAGNHDLSDDPDDVDGGAFDASSTHNLIGYDPDALVPSGNGNIRGISSAINPRLAALDFYGGLTKTHALLYDSQAIDAGDNDIVDEFEIAFDQRGSGYGRRVDWGIDDRVDMGAFELAADEYFADV